MYHIRISSTDDKFTRFYIQNFRSYFLVQEDADDEVKRTHTHCHVEGLLFEEQTIRNKLSVLTDKNKDKMFSFTKVKKGRDDNLQYLSKGKSRDEQPHVLLNNIITVEEIRRYHEVYWEIKLRTRSARPKNVSFLELCIEKALTDDYKEKWKSDHDYITNHQKRAMFMLVTGLLGEKRKILDSMIIRRLCNGVFNVIMPLKYRDDVLYNQVYGDNTRLE